jgi:PAS domain S-box-containing protein
MQLVDRKVSEFVGRPLFETLPEVKESVQELLDGVINTGIPYHGSEVAVPVNRYGMQEMCYFDFLYHPLKEDDGNISGIIVTVTEVSEQVAARKKIEKSESRFRSLIAQSPVAMVVLKGPEHVYEIANSAMLKRWNKSKEELINKKLVEIFPEIKDQKFPALLDEVYQTGKVYRESEAVSNLKNNGEKALYVDFDYSPLFEADGSVSGVIVSVNDVTEKVEARMKIEESEKKFRLLADSMPQHIWTSDIEGNLNYFNRSVFDYSGLTAEQINKDGWIQIVHPEDRDENIIQWTYAIATGKDFLFEHRFRRHDGVYRWMLSRAIPQKDEDGRIQMWVGTSTDIQDIKEMDQQKDSFLSMASHELKTPVTTIKAYGQIAEALL